MSWDLLDETSNHVVEQVVKDEDQGPSKEWGHIDGIIILQKNKLSWKEQGKQNLKLQGFNINMCRELICY